MAGEDLHENANISGDLRSQLSCESGDVGNLSEADDGNNGKGIRNEDEFQEVTVVADQNEPIEASQRKSEAEQVSTGEGKDSLNPDCQQNPGVVTERQDRSEQAPDQKNVTDAKPKSRKSATTTVAKRPFSCHEVPRLPKDPITFSRNSMHAIGKKKNNRSQDSLSGGAKVMSPASNGSLAVGRATVTPRSNGTVAQPTATNKIASTGVQSSDVKAARCMSATSAASLSTTKKQQGNADLTRPKSQKSATTTAGKGPCSGVEVQNPSLPQNPITPKGVSNDTVAQPAATNKRASTIVKSYGNAAPSSTTKKQQKSATTTVAKGPCSGPKVKKPTLPLNPPSKGVSKVAEEKGMDAIGKKKNNRSQDSLSGGAEVMSPASNGPLSLSATIRSNIQNEKPLKQDEMKEEYEDTGSETSSNSTAIGSKARPGSASSATDFNEKQKEEYQEAENKQPRKSLRSNATPISSSCQEAAQPKVELKKLYSDFTKTSNRRGVQHRRPLSIVNGREFQTPPHLQHGQHTGGQPSPFLPASINFTPVYQPPPPANISGAFLPP